MSVEVLGKTTIAKIQRFCNRSRTVFYWLRPASRKRSKRSGSQVAQACQANAQGRPHCLKTHSADQGMMYVPGQLFIVVYNINNCNSCSVQEHNNGRYRIVTELTHV